jgi:hypothetical protein
MRALALHRNPAASTLIGALGACSGKDTMTLWVSIGNKTNASIDNVYTFDAFCLGSAGYFGRQFLGAQIGL